MWNRKRSPSTQLEEDHANLHKNTTSTQKLLIDYAEKLTKDSLGTLELIDTGLNLVMQSIGVLEQSPDSTTGSQARGLLNLGGDILKWLFGTPNNEDLEKLNKELLSNAKDKVGIVHTLEDQATIIGENLQQSQFNSENIKKLRDVLEDLDKQFGDFRADSVGHEFTDLMIKIDYAYSDIHQHLNWLEQYVDNLSISFATLALGQLPPGLLLPTKFHTVLESISRNLPPNWALAVNAHPTNLWLFYKETKVSTAIATESSNQKGLKLFIHVPIYELKYQFYLYQVYNIPIYNPNTTHGVKYEDLPEYLAVSKDEESFITLSEKELDQCIQSTPVWICPPIRAFNRIVTTHSCILSLFYNDKDIQTLCTQVLVPRIVYT